MWSSVFIALLCVLIPPAYTQGISTTIYGPLEPPNCGFSNVTLRRVVGGQPSTIGAWPWMTALGYNSGNPAKPNWWCGGSLISMQHVLTAAHCLGNGLYLVRIGDLDLENDYDVAQPFQDRIQSVTMHPNYIPATLTNDIAVLKTYNRVSFTSILHPICLPIHPEIRNKKLDHLHAMVAGWGRIYHQGPASSKLLHTQLPITTEQFCRRAHQQWFVIDGRVVCAGAGGLSACNGDSGGPLMIPSSINQKYYYLIGVVSGGSICAHPEYPGVFTRVTSFLDFVTRSMV